MKWLLLAIGWGLAPNPAHAHAFAPSLLELVEEQPGQATVHWKQPATRIMGSALRPILPDTCRSDNPATVHTEGTGVVARWAIVCAAPLEGQVIAVEGMAESRTDVLLRLVLADGRTVQQVLTADRPSLVVPDRVGVSAVLAGYIRLGWAHILSGLDHLLFVLGLVLLVGGNRRLFWTVTAFTAGHSVTLALAVLGVLHVPQRPVEALIALSIYMLAVELAQGRQTRPGLLARTPWLLAGLFGLFHGLGFADALVEAGFPDGEIPLALVSFNIGIEVGQLVFVGVVLVVWAALRALPLRWPAWSVALPVYAIGSVAVFWALERTAALFE